MEDNITSKSTQSKSKLQEKIIKQAQGRSKTNYLCDRVRYTQVSYFGYYVQIIFSYLVAVTIVAVGFIAALQFTTFYDKPINNQGSFLSSLRHYSYLIANNDFPVFQKVYLTKGVSMFADSLM